MFRLCSRSIRPNLTTFLLSLHDGQKIMGKNSSVLSIHLSYKFHFHGMCQVGFTQRYHAYGNRKIGRRSRKIHAICTNSLANRVSNKLSDLFGMYFVEYLISFVVVVFVLFRVSCSMDYHVGF